MIYTARRDQRESGLYNKQIIKPAILSERLIIITWKKKNQGNWQLYKMN